MSNNLVYGISDKPKFSKLIVFAIQQLLAIIAATIAVPAIVGNGMSASAALFGAGVGTIVYQLLPKFRSPVFLGSSFAFIGSMLAAFAGASSASVGYAGSSSAPPQQRFRPARRNAPVPWQPEFPDCIGTYIPSGLPAPFHEL